MPAHDSSPPQLIHTDKLACTMPLNYHSPFFPLIIIIISIACVCAELMILELFPGFQITKFSDKYSQFLKPSNIEHLTIGNISIIMGDIHTDVLKSLYFDTSIKSITSDGFLTLASLPTNNDNNDNTYSQQHFAPRHLVRLSQGGKILRKQKMDYSFKNVVNPANVYVLDTGIESRHPDFNDRVINRRLEFTKQKKITLLQDLNGHGTSVASVVGSQLLGSCKNCNIIGYTVLDTNGIGRVSTLLKVLSKIAQNETPGVILFPFTTKKCDVLNDVLDELKNTFNFTLVAAAGNMNDDACNYSPASSNSVVTVGSIDSTTDTISKFTNFGRCVDIFADGVNVFTLKHTIPGQEEKKSVMDGMIIQSGTSFSAGIAAGVLATMRGIDNINIDNNVDASLKMMVNVAVQDGIEPHEFFQQTQTKNRILCNYLGNV